MGKKSEARAQKKAEAQARFEASKKALLAKVQEMATPRRTREPVMDAAPRLAWGFIVQAHFHFVWWDREHSLYPTEPH